jgi:ABC-type polysaccharide/polyol phosphate export permease
MNLKKYLNLRDFISFLKGLYNKRKIIFQLVEKDIKSQFLGSFLGITWSFVQPLMYVGVIWFVFSIGLRGVSTKGGVPFVLYLVSGIIAWFFFSDCLNSGASSILQNNYLVKKVVFRVSMLPVVKILSALFIHTFFLVFVIILYAVHGMFLDVFYLQLVYYLFATFVLVLGLSWITSSVILFFRDLQQIIQIIVRIGFWFTPIFWSIERIPPKYQWIVKLNPAFYLVQGYRDCLIHKTWFWERPQYTLYFWFLTLLILALGTIIFRRLKPHFADVL